MSRTRLPELPCMCGNFRRTSRALTQLYEEAMRPLGLRATQLTILQALSRAGEVSQGQLGEMLAMASSSTSAVLCFFAARGFLVDFFGILEAPIEFEFCTSQPAACWANMLGTTKNRPRSRTHALFMILTSSDLHSHCESLPSGRLTSTEENA